MSRPRVMVGAMAGVRGGPRTYAIELANALVTTAPDLKILWLSEVDPTGLSREIECVRKELFHPVLRPFWDRYSVPRALKAHRVDLYHNTKNALPARRAGAYQVVTIHDLAPFRTPETFSPLSRRFLVRSMRRAARRADAVIAVSQSTKDDIVEILGTAAERVHVVHNGVNPAFFVEEGADRASLRGRWKLDRPYLLFAGTIQPRKNPDVVLDAWFGLPREVRVGRLLVFAGRPGWKAAGLVASIRSAESEGVRFLTGVPDEDMPLLYAGAELFLSPSSYEGFGLTVAEAMAAGTCVIAGKGSSLPEVVADAGVLVPPRDADHLRNEIAELLGDEARRKDLAARGRARAARFTWKRAAEETAAVYRAVLGA